MLCAALAVLAAPAAPAGACSVPVFRYALERWTAEPYAATVLHRGPLSPADDAAVAALKAAEPLVGLRVVDLDAPPADAADLPPVPDGAGLPQLVIGYPEFFQIPEAAWAGPLTLENVRAALDSPVRRELARRLIAGDTAVMLLLEGGDAAKDAAAAKMLDETLARLAKELKIPPPPDGVWNDPVYDSQGAPPLKVAFSVLRVSRADPAEAAFVRILTACGRNMTDTTEPIVLPLFGRGRALCAFMGSTLDAVNIEDACVFLTGPCSCVVKSENPGLDMLMQVDWDGALAGQPSAIPVVEAPPLAGPAAFAAQQVAADDAGGDVEEASDARAALLRNVVLAAGAVALVAVVAAVVVWRRAHAGRG
jgi:hypothetical protein